MPDAPHLTSPHPAPPRRRGPRNGVRAVAAVGVVLAIAAGGSYAAGFGPFARGDDGPDPAAMKQARAFLADWAGGRLPSAAGRTTEPGKAQEVLQSFTAGLDIEKPKLTAEDDGVKEERTAPSASPSPPGCRSRASAPGRTSHGCRCASRTTAVGRWTGGCPWCIRG
ncbi:penicillin-binding transpeptidase domain-containing protein [Streptomyces violaceorubidus]